MSRGATNSRQSAAASDMGHECFLSAYIVHLMSCDMVMWSKTSVANHYSSWATFTECLDMFSLREYLQSTTLMFYDQLSQLVKSINQSINPPIHISVNRFMIKLTGRNRTTKLCKDTCDSLSQFIE